MVTEHKMEKLLLAEVVETKSVSFHQNSFQMNQYSIN